MAPDLNLLSQAPRDERSQPARSTSLSGRSGASSRRTSQLMGPPTVPASAAAPPLYTNAERVPMPHRVSSSHEHDGPLRHPRPLTAAELYAECEKEQEAVVCIPHRSAVHRANTKALCRSTASLGSLLLCEPSPHPWPRTTLSQAPRPQHPYFRSIYQTPTQHIRFWERLTQHPLVATGALLQSRQGRSPRLRHPCLPQAAPQVRRPRRAALSLPTQAPTTA